MPAFMLLPPTSFAEEQPGMVAALQENAKGLTSVLDIYRTLRELMAMGSSKPVAERRQGESQLIAQPDDHSDIDIWIYMSIILFR